MQGTPRVRGPKTFGILSIIFGGLVAASAANNLQGAFDNPLPNDHFFDSMREFARVSLYANGALGVMSLWLVAIGIGQMKYKSWARSHTMMWSLFAIAIAIGTPILLIAVAGDLFVSLWLGIGGAIVLLPYPIILAVYFQRATVREAMLA